MVVPPPPPPLPTISLAVTHPHSPSTFDKYLTAPVSFGGIEIPIEKVLRAVTFSSSVTTVAINCLVNPVGSSSSEE